MNALRSIASLVAIALLPTICLAQKPDNRPPLVNVRLAIEVTRVVNGDTVEAKIHLPWSGGFFANIKTIGFDAIGSEPAYPLTVRAPKPEPPTPEQVKAGKAAARALQEILDQGEVYAEPEGKGEQDTKGRLLARLWVKDEGGDLIDVAKWMRSKGHARPDKEPADKKPIKGKPVDENSPDFKPAKPVTPVKPKGNSGASRQSKRLDQLASQPQGLQVPAGQGGFGGFCPLCQQSRKNQMPVASHSRQR